MIAQALSFDACGPGLPAAAALRRTAPSPVLAARPVRLAAPAPASQESDILAGWIVATAGGNRQAFRSLYAATSGKLLGTILRLLIDRGEAEDLLQDVYVKIWRNAASFDAARGRPMTWLITIARYCAIDRLRLRSRYLTVDLDQAPEAADPSPAADFSIEASDDARRLDAALAKLAPRHAAIIRSAYFEGLTYEALAIREGVSTGTLKSWVHRGLARMRAELVDEEP